MTVEADVQLLVVLTTLALVFAVQFAACWVGVRFAPAAMSLGTFLSIGVAVTGLRATLEFLSLTDPNREAVWQDSVVAGVGIGLVGVMAALAAARAAALGRHRRWGYLAFFSGLHLIALPLVVMALLRPRRGVVADETDGIPAKPAQ